MHVWPVSYVDVNVSVRLPTYEPGTPLLGSYLQSQYNPPFVCCQMIDHNFIIKYCTVKWKVVVVVVVSSSSLDE